jgi:hypothetical protein
MIGAPWGPVNESISIENGANMAAGASPYRNDR